ncbi:response regulator [Lachnospiraceae bacterium 62-26]
MLKVLVVDDEFIVRAGLINCINWNQMNLSLVGEAANGKEALSLILNRRPDIVLLDLIMPVMSGMELIEKIAELNIKTNIIILSCHEDYSYVRQAFKYGVRDYILKLSSTPEEICEVISDVAAKIVTGQQSSAELSPALPISDNTEERNLLSECRYYYVITFHLPMYTHLTKSDLLLCRNWLLDCPDSAGIFQLCEMNEIPFILYKLQAEQSADTTRQNLTASLKKLLTYLDIYTKYSLLLGLSGCCACKTPLSKALRESIKAIDILFYNTGSRVALSENLCNSFSSETSRRFTKLSPNTDDIISNNLNILLAYVKNYYIDKAKFEEVSPKLLKLDAIDFVNSLHHYLLQKGLSFADIDEKYLTSYQDIAKALSFEELKEYILCLTDDFTHFILQTDSSEIRSDILAVQAYIEEHYFMDISLQDAAEYIHITKNHLSYIFKKETGTNFVDYLTNYRIRKAKELLSSAPQSTVAEIAESVGFRDTGYFCKVFKKATGFTPNRFRKGV